MYIGLHYNILMKNRKKWFLFLMATGLLSCSRENEIATNSSVLMSNSWYPYQQHAITYNDSSNVVLKDTTFFTQACDQQSFYQFLSDSIVKRQDICSGLPVKQGKWYVTSDVISAYIPVPLNYGTGVVYKNIGIDLSKLVEIDAIHFVTKSVSHIYGYIPPTGASTHVRIENFTTFKVK